MKWSLLQKVFFFHCTTHISNNLIGYQVQQFGATETDAQKWWDVVLIYSTAGGWPCLLSRLTVEPFTELSVTLDSITAICSSTSLSKQDSDLAYAKESNKDTLPHKRAVSHEVHSAPPTTTHPTLHSTSEPKLDEVVIEVKVLQKMVQVLTTKVLDLKSIINKQLSTVFTTSNDQLYNLTKISLANLHSTPSTNTTTQQAPYQNFNPNFNPSFNSTAFHGNNLSSSYNTTSAPGFSNFPPPQ